MPRPTAVAAAAMQFVATAQPYLQQCSGPAHATTMLTLTERCKFVDDLDAGALGVIPVCIDHAGAEGLAESDAAFRVPGRLVIGRIVHALVRPNGQLLIVGEVYFERPEARRIAQDIESGAHPWGVSLCTDLTLAANQRSVLSKLVTHLGLTQIPEYGAENTWLHLAARSWPALYRALGEEFTRREPAMYMSASLRQLIAAASDSGSATVQTLATRRHPPGQTEAVLRLTKSPRASSPHLRANPMSDAADSSTPTPTVVMTDAPPMQAASAPTPDGARLIQEIDTFMGSLQDPATKGVVIDVAHLTKANQLRNELMTFLKQNGMTNMEQWPPEVMDRAMALRLYENKSTEETNKWNNEFHKDDAVTKAQISRALQNPLLPDNLPIVQQVMASRKAVLFNQREMEEKLQRMNQEIKTKDEQLSTRDLEIADLKRKFSDMTGPVPAGSAAAAAAVFGDSLSKRQRTTESLVQVASSQASRTTPAPAAAPAAAPQFEGKIVMHDAPYTRFAPFNAPVFEHLLKSSSV